MCAKSFLSKACRAFFSRSNSAVSTQITALVVKLHDRLFVSIDKAALRPGTPWHEASALLSAGKDEKHEYAAKDGDHSYTLIGDPPQKWRVAMALRMHPSLWHNLIKNSPVISGIVAVRGLPKMFAERMVLDIEVLNPRDTPVFRRSGNRPLPLRRECGYGSKGPPNCSRPKLPDIGNAIPEDAKAPLRRKKFFAFPLQKHYRVMVESYGIYKGGAVPPY